MRRVMRKRRGRRRMTMIMRMEKWRMIGRNGRGMMRRRGRRLVWRTTRRM